MKKKLLYTVLCMNICHLACLYTQNFNFINPNSDLLAVGKEGTYQEITDLIRIYGADINTRNPNQRTPLMLAAIWDNVATVEKLLGFQPKLDLQDKDGNTAMILAIDTRPYERITKNTYLIVQRLLEYGANPLIKNLNGQTALDFVTKKEIQDEWATKTRAILQRYISKFL